MKKKIWILKSGEPLIFDSDCERLLRSSTLAHYLNKQKYNVTYFVDSFNHFTKYFRKNKPISYDSVNYRFLKGCGYKKNKSLKRLLHNIIISIHFLIINKKKPDVVIVSFPPIFLTFAVAIYCYFYKVKYVIDFRDAWPNIFFSNQILKKISILLFFPLVRFSIKHSFKLAGCAPFFEDFSRQYYKSYPKKEFKYIPHTYLTSCSNYKNNINNENNDKIKLVYLGIISNQRRIDEFIEYFKSYKNNNNMDLIICGNGDLYEKFKKKYSQNNIKFTGYVNLKKMNFYSEQASIGVAPYELNEGFKNNIPNKIIEYMNYGLTIITNLQSPLISRLNKDLSSLIYNYKDPKELLEIFDDIVKNKSKFNKFRKSSIKEIFNKKFGPNSFIKKFESLIQ